MCAATVGGLINLSIYCRSQQAPKMGRARFLWDFICSKPNARFNPFFFSDRKKQQLTWWVLKNWGHLQFPFSLYHLQNGFFFSSDELQRMPWCLIRFFSDTEKGGFSPVGFSHYAVRFSSEAMGQEPRFPVKIRCNPTKIPVLKGGGEFSYQDGISLVLTRSQMLLKGLVLVVMVSISCETCGFRIHSRPAPGFGAHAESLGSASS